jgi:hypothetical protein
MRLTSAQSGVSYAHNLAAWRAVPKSPGALSLAIEKDADCPSSGRAAAGKADMIRPQIAPVEATRRAGHA